MSRKYKNVRAKGLYFGTEEGEIRVTTKEESQLDRVENKVDRILELLGGQDLSTFVENNNTGFITAPVESATYKKSCSCVVDKA